MLVGELPQAPPKAGIIEMRPIEYDAFHSHEFIQCASSTSTELEHALPADEVDKRFPKPASPERALFRRHADIICEFSKPMGFGTTAIPVAEKAKKCVENIVGPMLRKHLDTYPEIPMKKRLYVELGCRGERAPAAVTRKHMLMLCAHLHDYVYATTYMVRLCDILIGLPEVCLSIDATCDKCNHTPPFLCRSSRGRRLA